MKFKRLPNGFGSITKLSGKLRRPFMARKRVNGKLIPVGYFTTRLEAYNFLLTYATENLPSEQTFKEVYELSCDERYGKGEMTDGRRHMNCAFNHCTELWDKKMVDVTIYDIERLRDSDLARTAKKRLKEMFAMMYDYSVRHDIVLKDTSKNAIWKTDRKTERIPVMLSHDEMETLIINQPDCESRDFSLMLMFTGMRPAELLDLKVENIDLKHRIAIGGKKTEKGRNRKIYLHSAIIPVIQKRLDKAPFNASERLFRSTYTQTMNDLAKKELPDLMERWQYRDFRHLFQTRARECGCDSKFISDQVGHTDGANITLSVYTHLSDEYCLKELEKLTF